MVNAAKRVRALMVQLFHIRNGTAAVSLPPPPRPQLTSIYMRIPTGAWPKSEVGGEGKAKSQSLPFKEISGARQFWRRHLQRLKYRNPALAVQVETIAKDYGTPTYMSLKFDSPDRAALQRIDANYDLLERTTKAAEGEGGEEQKNKLVDEAALSKRDAEAIDHAPEDKITTAAQPAADPSARSSTSPPATLYTRTVTLPLVSFPADSIWRWFRQTTGCAEGETNEAELEEHQKLEAFLNGPSKRDRERVKAGRDAMAREEADLKKAREAAERIAAEAA